MFKSKTALTTMRRLMFTMIFLFAVAVAGAQTDTGKIAGEVTDPTGAKTPGAQVTVTNQSTGISRTDQADSNGLYTFPGLPTGQYSISVKAAGFQAMKQTGIQLDASSDRNVNFQLTVGQVDQQVVVEANTQAQVETGNAQIASTITAKQIEDIPLNGRNYVQLLRLLPGTIAATLDPFAIQLGSMSAYVNGVRGASILNMADGLILEDIGANISVFSVPNADSIAQTRVLAASFGADNPSPYGGATINVVTKTGGHDFHGNLFEFNRNTLFNAKQDFASINQPLHFNDYGFTLGGPLYIPGHFNTKREKLFFFVSEEWKSIHQNSTSTNTVPTIANTMGIFTTPVYQPGTKTPYAAGSCTQNPTVMNNAATGYCVPRANFSINGPRLLAAYPAPNASVGATNYITSVSNILENREDRYNVDYLVTPKDLISVRFAEETNKQALPGSLGVFIGTAPRPAYLYSVNYTRTFSSNLINALVIGETHNKFTSSTVTSIYTPAALGLTYAQPLPGVVNVVGSAPTLAITNLTSIAPAGHDTKTLENLVLSDDLSFVKGKHTMKFGTYNQHSKDDEHNLTSSYTQGNVTFSTTATTTSGNAIADTLLGNFQQYLQSSIPGYFVPRYRVSEFYAQDNWKATSKLAVDYGLRYSYSQPPYSAINNISFFNPSLYSAAQAPTINANGTLGGTYNPYNGIQIVGTGFPAGAKAFLPNLVNNPAVLSLFSGSPRGVFPTPKTEFSPRVGVAYDPRGDGKTSIRAGFGIFFLRQNTLAYSYASQNLPFNINDTILNGNIDNPGGVAGAVFPTSLYTFPAKFKPAYLMTRNVGVQHQFPKGIILDVNYVGNQAIHMPLVLNINQLPQGSTINAAGVKNTATPNSLRPYKGFTDIDQQVYEDTSNYNSLQSTASRRVSRGLNFSVSFTWSKTMEGTSQNLPGSTLPENSYNYQADYSVADIHRSKVTTGNVVYELPFLRQSPNRLLRETLGGWTVTGVFQFQTGAPLNPTLTSDVAGIGASSGSISGQGQRLQIVPGVSPYTHQKCSGLSKFPVCQYLNIAAFTPPANATFGNASRNYVVGPDYTQTDVSAYKHFHFVERLDLELRAEAFNIFNRDSLTTVGTSYTPGVTNNANPALNTTTFGQVTTSTPGRVLQFGAKLAF